MKELVIGVDIGGTRTKYGLVDITCGEVLFNIVQPTLTQDENEFIQQVGKVIIEFKELAQEIDAHVNSIGIGVPGFTREDGLVETTYGFIRFMEKYPLKDIIEKSFNLPCLVDNDARTVSMGEAIYGKGKNFNRVLNLTLGTGVGFGMVVGGSFQDALPLSHMGGHITITDTDHRCYCGKTGCLEDLVGAAGIQRLIKELPHSLNDSSIQELFVLAANNNKEALHVVDIITGYLHTAIHNYSNLFAPDIIVLGGGISKGLAPYLAKIKGDGYMSSYPGYSFNLVVSDLEEQAGILGSASLSKLFTTTNTIVNEYKK